ncbi:endonuclease III [Candidatus Uhrbacteria bacterium]|nr:endonuclease III [Candidatus Uhrbacteria bacterium]
MKTDAVFLKLLKERWPELTATRSLEKCWQILSMDERYLLLSLCARSGKASHVDFVEKHMGFYQDWKQNDLLFDLASSGSLAAVNVLYRQWYALDPDQQGSILLQLVRTETSAAFAIVRSHKNDVDRRYQKKIEKSVWFRSQEIFSILQLLKKRWPNPGAMEIGNPYQNLVGVLLSARTRDEQVLKLMPGFFKAFPTPQKLAKATTKQIEQKINTIGMFRQKAKNLKSMAVDVVEKFDAEIPDTMEELVSLAGVGRKTASVVLVASFDTPAIAVDTHVHRVTNRLGWVKTKTPEKTEEALLKIVPDKMKKTVNQVFVKHGRYICISKPRCWACPVREQCAFKQKNLAIPKNAEEMLTDIKRRELELEQLREQAV